MPPGVEEMVLAEACVCVFVCAEVFSELNQEVLKINPKRCLIVMIKWCFGLVT